MELLIIPSIMLLVWAICEIMIFFEKRKEKRFNKQHPEYIEFKNKFYELQCEASEIWNSTMPNGRKEVDRYLGEMKYYPEHSEKYQYLNNKLNVARRQIEECQKRYDEKAKEIHLFVQANKAAIDNIKDADPESYENWVKRYNL